MMYLVRCSSIWTSQKRESILYLRLLITLVLSYTHIAETNGYENNRAWVPNLFETMSHCPIDDSEMSQCAIAHRTYMLIIAVKF